VQNEITLIGNPAADVIETAFRIRRIVIPEHTRPGGIEKSRHVSPVGDNFQGY